MRRKLPNLNALKAFDAVARHESVSRAASELGVTHAAVSKQVANLENDLRVVLFERTNRKIALSKWGRIYFQSIRPAFEEISRATAALSVKSSPKHLRLSVETGFATRCLLPRLEDFRRKHRGLVVDLVPAADLAPFTSGEVDAAIHFSLEDIPESTTCEKITDVHIFPVCSPDFLTISALERVEDVVRLRLIHEVSDEWWRRWLKRAGIEVPDLTLGPVFHDTNLALNAAIYGQGIAIGDSVLSSRVLKK